MVSIDSLAFTTDGGVKIEMTITMTSLTSAVTIMTSLVSALAVLGVGSFWMTSLVSALAVLGVGSFWKPCCRKRSSHAAAAPINARRTAEVAEEVGEDVASLGDDKQEKIVENDEVATGVVFAAPNGNRDRRYHRLPTCAGKNAFTLTPCDTCCKKVSLQSRP